MMATSGDASNDHNNSSPVKDGGPVSIELPAMYDTKLTEAGIECNL